MKTKIAIVLAALAVLLVAGCGGGSTPAKPGTVVLNDINQAEVNLIRSLPVMGIPPAQRKRLIASWGGVRRNVKVQCDWTFTNGDLLCKIYQTNIENALEVRYRSAPGKSFAFKVIR